MEPSNAKGPIQLPTRQLVNPDPRKRPKRHLQRARPVDPAMKRIARDPALELGANFIQIPGFAGRKMGLRQHDQMLMPVQLPNHFVVAGSRRIQIGNQAEVTQPGLNSALVIATPLNLACGIYGCAEDWKLMAFDLIGQIDDLLRALDCEELIRKRQTRDKVGIEDGRGWTQRKNHVYQFLPRSG